MKRALYWNVEHQELRPWDEPQNERINQCPHGYWWTLVQFPCSETPDAKPELPGWWYCDCVTHASSGHVSVYMPCQRPYDVHDHIAAVVLAKLRGEVT